MTRWISFIVGSLCLIMAIFHLYSGGIQLFPAMQQRSVHLGLSLAIIFLIYPFIAKDKDANQTPTKYNSSFFISILLSAISIVIMIYIFINHINIISMMNSPSNITILAGCIMIILTLDATRRVIGWALPIIAMLFLLYAYRGQNLPLMFAHSGYSFEEIVTRIGLSNQGIFGTPLGVSATFIVLFVIFGSLLAASGAGKLFIDLSMAMVGRFRGGAAKVSIVASSLSGTISGNPVSNVVTTGVLTIPLMKKQGYKPEYAGAVETIASTGGMFLPPVMGAVSFIIADFLQVEYVNVLYAAIVPALLYFLALFIMVDLRAARIENDNKYEVEKYEPITLIIKQRGYLLIPIVVLVYLLLIERMTPNFSVFWAIVTIPIVSSFRKETRMNIKQFSSSLQEGIKLSLMVVVACACAGIVIGVIEMTGIGLRFAGMLVEISGGNLLLLLVLTMLSSIVIGMGLPPVASYLVLAILVAPALIDLGVSSMAAHFFIFYFGSLSLVTPPVAVAAYAASSLAKAGPNKTAFTALRLGSVAFIIPFLFVYGPPLLLEGTVFDIVLSLISAIIGVYALAVSFEGFLVKEVSKFSRMFMFLSALLLMYVDLTTDIIGAFIVSIVTFVEIKKSIQGKKQIKEEEVKSINL